MRATVTFDKRLPLVGLNEKKQKTIFDASLDFAGEAKHASPMEVVLESLAACSMMDIIVILDKMKKALASLDVALEASRADDHPKVFTSIHLKYRLTGSGCGLEEFRRAVALSIEKYCSVAAMLRASGCGITWEAEVCS
jgi:putative redox protein